MIVFIVNLPKSLNQSDIEFADKSQSNSSLFLSDRFLIYQTGHVFVVVGYLLLNDFAVASTV
jgi:hypothetical protein